MKRHLIDKIHASAFVPAWLPPPGQLWRYARLTSPTPAWEICPSPISQSCQGICPCRSPPPAWEICAPVVPHFSWGDQPQAHLSALPGGFLPRVSAHLPPLVQACSPTPNPSPSPQRPLPEAPTGLPPHPCPSRPPFRKPHPQGPQHGAPVIAPEPW